MKINLFMILFMLILLTACGKEKKQLKQNVETSTDVSSTEREKDYKYEPDYKLIEKKKEELREIQRKKIDDLENGLLDIFSRIGQIDEEMRLIYSKISNITRNDELDIYLKKIGDLSILRKELTEESIKVRKRITFENKKLKNRIELIELLSLLEHAKYVPAN